MLEVKVNILMSGKVNAFLKRIKKYRKICRKTIAKIVY